jgi:hypothetical protein
MECIEPSDADFAIAIAALRQAYKMAANVADRSPSPDVAARHAAQAKSLSLVIAYLYMPAEP